VFFSRRCFKSKTFVFSFFTCIFSAVRSAPLIYMYVPGSLPSKPRCCFFSWLHWSFVPYSVVLALFAIINISFSIWSSQRSRCGSINVDVYVFSSSEYYWVVARTWGGRFIVVFCFIIIMSPGYGRIGMKSATQCTHLWVLVNHL